MLEGMYNENKNQKIKLTEDKVFESVLNEANYVKLDSATKRKRLLRQATLMAAMEAQDPLYFKYKAAANRKKDLRAKIQQKYEGRGRQKLAEYEQRAHAKDF